MKTTVGDVMTTQVRSASPATPFRSIAATLTSLHVSALPVVAVEGEKVKIVSEADMMLKELYGSHPSHADAWLPEREMSKVDAAIAADLMSSPAITIRAGATLA